MNERLICVLSSRTVPGWPPKEADAWVPEGAPHVVYGPLGEMLTTAFDSDAHFVAYSYPARAVRLNDEAAKLLATVLMILLVFEVDCPKADRDERGYASEAWWQAERAKVERLRADEPGVYCFRTRGGYRLVAWLPEPVTIDGPDAARAWSESYLLAAAHLHARYGLLPDHRCANWGRLQRCPGAVRGDGAREPQEALGDPWTVGEWRFPHLDIDAAREALVDLGWSSTPQLPAHDAATIAELPDFDAEKLLAELVPHVSAVGAGGGRHYLYLALCGTLLDRGVPPKALPPFIAALSERAGQDDATMTQDRVKAAHSSVARARAGQLLSRIGTLAAKHPEVAEALDRALPPKRSKAEEAIVSALTRPVDPNDLRFSLDLASDHEVAVVVVRALRASGIEPVWTQDAFWLYDPATGLWRPNGRNVLERQVHELDGAPYGQKGTFKVNDGRVKGALARAATLVAVPSFFDEAPTGIVFVNGFLRVTPEGAELVEHDPAHRATFGLPFAFDANATAPTWSWFLSDIFRGDVDADAKITLLQEFVGACFAGNVTRLQRCLVLFGEVGANGKSTFIKAIQQLFPADAVTSVPPQKFHQEYYLARLARSRINLVAETPRADIDGSESFKGVITGDEQEGRHPKGQPFRYRPRAGHIFAANTLPGTNDQTAAWWRRFVVVTFNRSFAEAEQDRALEGKLVAELAGIAAWAIAGAVNLARRGDIVAPASSAQVREEWRRNSDQVSLFVEEKVTPEIADDEPGTGGSEIYSVYREWAVANGHKPLSHVHFGSRLKGLGFTKQHTKKGEMWPLRIRGVAMRSVLKSI